MNSLAATGVVLLVAVAACVLIGATRPVEAPEDWSRHAAFEVTVAQRARDAAALWLPFPVDGREYARLVDLRIAGWMPIVPAGLLFMGWLLTWAFDRRASGGRIPSPAIAFLAKRGFCAGILLGGIAIVVPIAVPPWFGYVPWVILAGSAHVYVANLPERL